MINSVCVFCGSSNNVDEKYFDIGREIGNKIAKNKYHMVYGAGDCGVMRAAANGALEKNGTVTGVFPRVLDGLEAEHKNLTEIIIVDDMHTRKMTMFEKSDAFLILPGGFGTMDETFEVITWKQLHTHNKPIIFYNFEDYWKYWIKLTDHFIENKFASENTRKLYDIVDNIDDIFKLLSKAK